jgi:FkbM family methyltransferase
MHTSPKFTEYVIKQKIFAENPLAVVDVGARGGPEPHWVHYKDHVKIAAFEPDEKECEALNKRRTSSRITYYPVALHEKEGTYEFYELGTPDGASFYKMNYEFVNRFPDEMDLEVKGHSRVRATTLDLFLAKNKAAHADFIKVDTEGSELDVLQGAKNTLESSVLGISCEVLFVPWRSNKVFFSDVERFLYELGFKLYDLSLHKYARKSFPGPESSWGQTVVGQAIFFRDPVEEIKKGPAEKWNEMRVYKLASLFEVFGFPDVAIELLGCAHEEGLIKTNEETRTLYKNLISKSYTGTTYEKHLKKLEKIRKRGYTNLYEMLKARARRNPLANMARKFITDPRLH